MTLNCFQGRRVVSAVFFLACCQKVNGILIGPQGP